MPVLPFAATSVLAALLAASHPVRRPPGADPSKNEVSIETGKG
jgi:hypothetical protein